MMDIAFNPKKKKRKKNSCINALCILNTNYYLLDIESLYQLKY